MKRKGLPGPYFKIRSGIYRITCIPTLDSYVGKSKNLHQRWCQHSFDLKQNRHPNPKLQELYNSHTATDFVMELIELVEDTDTLETREAHWIKTFSPTMNVTDTKLSIADVNIIKELNEKKLPLEEIASQFNISVKYLKEILSGYRWGSS